MSPARRRVVVTGLGLVSPWGNSVESAFAQAMAGQSAIRCHAVGDAPHSVTIASAVCSEVDPAPLIGRSRSAAMDRVGQLAVQAAGAAWADAGLDVLGEEARERVAVLLGTCVGGAQSTERGYRDLFVRNRSRLSPLTVVQCMNNAPASHIAQLYGLGGACHTYSVACASAAAAIADAARRIRAGDGDVVITGGSEAALPYGIVKAWLSMQVLAPAADDDAARAACRPFAADRNGLVLGEGAAVFTLEEREHALGRGARIYAELAGSGSSCDHGHITAPLAAGQMRALREALRDACADPDEVRYVNAHGTATPEGDPVEIDALRQFFGAQATKLAVSATKSMHGHLMGAAGAIEALLTVMAVHKGMIPPTGHRAEIDPACTGVDHVLGEGREVGRLPLALSNSFAFGGSNVVLAFRAPG
ncbi:MAG TPA: beta-ketoacyl-[acyl-carrier-protein] synthase family protein [Rubrivivax sp.]|nr:beta-ketoacyl-[acyl-carrier-protein] synthase family protein [Rubrivivax sp.]